MPHSIFRKAFLVIPIVTAGQHGPVYAVVTCDPSDAVDAVAAELGKQARELSFTGVLSRRMAHRLGLKPGEVRRI